MWKVADPWEPLSPKSPPDPDPLPWIGIGLVAFVLLSYPWLSPFTQGKQVLGIPLILWYLMGTWALLVVLGALQRPEA